MGISIVRLFKKKKMFVVEQRVQNILNKMQIIEKKYETVNVVQNFCNII